MIPPYILLAVGLFFEMAVQLFKRLVYFGDGYAVAYNWILGIGDAAFFLIFFGLLKVISFNRQQKITLGIVFLLIAYAMVVNGAFATVLAFRNTYFWLSIAILLLLEIKLTLEPQTSKSLLNVTLLFSAVMLVYAIFQIQMDYVFERPWFELSGSSLKYDGVTNFGTASKAFALTGGPTDLACFGLFSFAIGWERKNRKLATIGFALVLISGVRTIIFALPLWLFMARYFQDRLRTIFFGSIVVVTLLVYSYPDAIINYFYSLEISRFSLATIAPRVETWISIETSNTLLGNGVAANMIGDLSHADEEEPVAFDSEVVFMFIRMGLPLTLLFFYSMISIAQETNKKFRMSALSIITGVSTLASITQLTYHTRLPIFLICVIAYSCIYTTKKSNRNRIAA